MKIQILISITFLLLTPQVLAEKVEVVAQYVFQQVEKELTDLKVNDRLNLLSVNELVTKSIMPHTDRKYFTYKVLGKSLEKLSQSEKDQFVDLLSANLSASYANSLINYKQEKIVITNTLLAPSKKIASVTMKLIGNSKETGLTTKWRYVDQSNKWLMFDLTVEGISLLQTKQKEIGQSIAKTGIKETITKLQLKLNKS